MSKIQGVFGCSGLVKLFAQILSVLLCLCVVVLVAVVHGWESLSNKQQAFLFSLFFLSVFHMDVCPWKSLFFSVSHAVSFSHPSFCLFVSLSPFVSLSLTPFSFLRLDHQQRRRVKFSLFFLLNFSLCTLSACSSDHTSLPIIYPSSQLTFVLVCWSLFAIVHHGTAQEAQTQLNLVFRSLNE